jgi:hypothetical protein
MARFLFRALALALALTTDAIAQQYDLTGRWSANDGGTYYIRQVGNDLWWYGESGDGGRSWTNVLHASLQGNRVVGRWADVPHGTIHSAGEMDIQVVSADRLVATRSTGGFGGREWTRQGAPTASAPSAPGGVIDMLTIPNDKPLKVTSNVVLERGRWYVLEASGVITDWSDKKDGVDAVWCYAEWRCGKNGEAWNQLRIDDKGMSDLHGSTIPYNPQHVYRVRVQGQGKPLVAYASDAQNSWSDNAGSFTLRIYAEGGVAAGPETTGRSYTSQPRAQPASGNKFQDALKKGMQDAVKGMLK